MKLKKTYEVRTRFAARFGLAAAVIALLFLLIGVMIRERLDSHVFSSFCGMTGGLAGAGIGVFLSKRSILRSPEKLRASRISDYDERNQQIEQVSTRMAFWGFLILNYLLAVIVMFFDSRLYFYLCVQLLFMVILYGLCRWVCARRM